MVSGQVEILGTVTHPSFDSYGVFYAPGASPTGDSQWVEIVFNVREPVSNGVLAVWDTAAFTADGQRAVPNGVYTLALARYRQGSGEPDLQFVRNVTVNNVDITPTPTPAEEPTATPVEGTPTAVPVDQPETPTPEPAATEETEETPAAVGEADEDENGGDGDGDGEGGEGLSLSNIELPIDVSELRTAFLDGVKITLLLFGIWGVYVFLKAIVRYLMRTGRLRLDLPSFDLSQFWRRE
jgi:hypothetical protein